jgi:hypothetical protein
MVGSPASAAGPDHLRSAGVSPVSEDRQWSLLIAAGVVVGMALLIWGISRLVPMETATHATAEVEQQGTASTKATPA